MSKKTYDETVEKFKKMADKTGRGLDPGIFETVVTLNALGINTRQSCEGHMEWGLAGPWVDIEAKDQRLVEKYWNKAGELFKIGREKKDDKILMEGHKYNRLASLPNLREVKKAEDLLEEFYSNRKSDVDSRLIIWFFANRIGRIMNQGIEFQEMRKKTDKAKCLKKYQEEMKEFTDFLKKKFFSSAQSEVRVI